MEALYLPDIGLNYFIFIFCQQNQFIIVVLLDMKQTITTTLTIHKNILEDEDGPLYLQQQIDIIAEELAREKGFSSIQYLVHHLIEGYLDTSDEDHLSYRVIYEVES